MTVEKTFNGREMTVFVEGRVDTMTAPKLEEELKSSADQYDSLIMDLGKLDYISSAGLRVLLGAEKTMSKKGGMIVRNVSDSVMEIFEMTGFSDILKIQ